MRLGRLRGFAGRRGFSRWRDCAGSILLEVVVAAALVGLIVGPLAVSFSSTVERARAERQASAAAGAAGTPGSPGSGLDSCSAGSDPGPAWRWGTRVLAASWRPGPVLHVALGTAGSAAVAGGVVGFWVDGWPVGQMTVLGEGAGAGEAAVDASTWSGLAGHELVIRGREAGGPWGAPWRSAVSPASGGDPQAGSSQQTASADPALVLHRPSVGTSAPVGSWSVTLLALPSLPLLFVVGGTGLAGWSGVDLDGRSQWWWAEEGRSVDLYF